MTSNVVAALGGALLSILFSYVPGLQAAFSKLSSQSKSLIMAACIVAVAGASFGLSCAGLIDTVSCTKAGAWGLVETVVFALAANQGVYQLSPQKDAPKG